MNTSNASRLAYYLGLLWMYTEKSADLFSTNDCVFCRFLQVLRYRKQELMLYNYNEFTYLTTWWRHNCETLHTTEVYFTELHVEIKW